MENASALLEAIREGRAGGGSERAGSVFSDRSYQFE
jgi:hypothetical protein